MIRSFTVAMMLLMPFFLFSQGNGFNPYFEAGVTLGSSNYTGDLSHKTYVMSEGNFAGGILLRYNASQYLAFRGNVLFGRISGDDKNSDDEARLYRNLDFYSPITELSITPEWYILGHDYAMGKVFSPYLFAGVGVALFNPKTELEGTEFDLAPLRTEGQDEEYALSTISVPFGVGVKYAMSKSFNLGIEFGIRWTNTDYLDDVSGTYANWFESGDTPSLGQGEQRALADRFWENEEALGLLDFLSNPGVTDGTIEDGLTSTELAKDLYINGLSAGIVDEEGGLAQALPAKQGQNRGDTNASDFYNYLGVTLTYNFKKDANACPTFW